MVGEIMHPNDAEFVNLDGSVVSFGSEAYLWPHAEFLKFHNRRFAFKQMKAAAESKILDRHDTEETIIHISNAMDDWKRNWVNKQDVGQYEHSESDILIKPPINLESLK
jgi:hypothetical protein